MVIEDLGSTNGTYLNDEPLNGPQPLHDGDRIRIGDSRVLLPAMTRSALVRLMLRAAQTIWKTDTGRQRRDNEDSAFARAPLFVVADGMGGAQAGEVASQIAVEAFSRACPRRGRAEERLAARAREANRQIYEMLARRARAGRHGHDADGGSTSTTPTWPWPTSATAAPTCFGTASSGA